MKNRTALKWVTLAMALATLSAFGATEEKIHKQFPVKDGGTLVVDVDLGSINVSTNNGREVVVDVWRKITRKKKADEEAFLKEHPVKFSSDNDTVSVTSAGKPSSRGWSLNWKQRNEVKYTISVPSKFVVNLKTAGGGIQVNGTEGTLRANTSGGGLDFEAVKGVIQGHTSGGGIEVKNCEGKIQIETSGGGLHIAGGGGTLNGKTSGGGISLKDFKGPANISTSGGGIKIERGATPLHARTSGGSIEATLASFSDEVSLDSSAGHINIGVPATASFDLDASTSAGHVSCDLPITVQGKLQHDRVSGKVNGGGKRLSVHSSAGSIEVNKL